MNVASVCFQLIMLFFFFFSLESKWPVGLIGGSCFSSMATTMEDESGVSTSFT